MIRRPPRSTLSSSSAASDVYKRQTLSPETSVLVLTVARESKRKSKYEQTRREGELLVGQRLTWWQRLLQFLGLLSIRQDEGVQVSRASDLELRHGMWLGRSLGLCGSRCRVGLDRRLLDPGDYSLSTDFDLLYKDDSRVASFRRAISRNFLMSWICLG